MQKRRNPKAQRGSWKGLDELGPWKLAFPRGVSQSTEQRDLFRILAPQIGIGTFAIAAAVPLIRLQAWRDRAARGVL